MMNRKALISFFLLIMLLISNAGIAIQKHYCMGELESIEFIGKKDMCCEGMDCHAMSVKGCCEDHVEILESSDFNHKNLDLTIIPPFETVSMGVPLLNLLTTNVTQQINPPLRRFNISYPGCSIIIKHQSFLI